MKARDNKPEYINSCTMEDINNRKSADDLDQIVKKIPIDEAEKIFAAYRNIPTFTWMETLSNTMPSNNIINTDQIIVVYDKYIGYLLVAKTIIHEGQILIFTGEKYPGFPTDDASNPYVIPGKTTFNAKSIGGFASLMSNLPSQKEIYSFTNKYKQNHSDYTDSKNIASANFVMARMTNENAQEFVHTYKAKRDIKVGEILGITHGDSSRLMYNNFYAFLKISKDEFNSFKHLPEEMNNAFNQYFFTKFKYTNDLLWSEHIAIKIVTNLKNGGQKAPYLLQKLSFSFSAARHIRRVLSMLYDDELKILSEQKMPHDLKLELEEEHIKRKDGKNSFSHRQAIELKIKMNENQIQHRTTASMLLCFNNLGLLKRFVHYPGIIEDCKAIAEKYQDLNDDYYSADCKDYLNYCSLFKEHESLANNHRNTQIESPKISQKHGRKES